MTALQSLRRTLFPLLLGLSLALANTAVLAQEEDDDFFVFDEEENDTPTIADPLESINRVTFAFNDKMYRVVMKPIARGLRVLPEPVRNSGSNFFNNLGTPVSAINALLQLDLPNAGTEVSRFLLNSTFGILGLFDPATHMGIIRDNEDLGQTLGRYGMGQGFYVVLPFIGASSLRDGLGLFGDAAINPVYDQLGMSTTEIIGARALEAEIKLSLDQDTYEAFYDSALDPYIFFRSAYTQNRAGRVDE